MEVKEKDDLHPTFFKALGSVVGSPVGSGVEPMPPMHFRSLEEPIRNSSGGDTRV